MNKNTVYLAIFGVLCALAGVLAGAGIVKKASLPWQERKRPDFAERVGYFAGYESKGRQEKEGPGRIFKKLTKELGLTKEQQAQAREILNQMRQEIDRIGTDVRGSIVEIREEGSKKILAILTPAQQEKFQAMLGKLRERRARDYPGRAGIPERGAHPEQEALP